MTRRENVLAALRGERPAWVPFAPNFAQWFQHHRAKGTLPSELAGCGDYIAAMKALDCDICSRNLPGGFGMAERGPASAWTHTDTPMGRRSLRTIVTPHGTLTQIDQEQAAITTSHTEQYLVKDWDRDGRAFRAWFDRLEPTWDEAVMLDTIRRIGDDGVFVVPFHCTPLKFLHWHFGLDGTCYFCADHPDEAQALCDEWWARLRPQLRALADHPAVDAVILMDNVDAPFYPPRLARRYWAPYVAEAAALLRARGKSLFVHACGKLRALAPVFAETGVSGLEGVSHAPLGDWGPREAVGCHERFVYLGGWSGAEQRLDADGLARHYERFLADCPRERVVFTSSCNTAVDTPWERLVQLRGIIRSWSPDGVAATA